jgi:hypothetical protein
VTDPEIIGIALGAGGILTALGVPHRDRASEATEPGHRAVAVDAGGTGILDIRRCARAPGHS